MEIVARMTATFAAHHGGQRPICGCVTQWAAVDRTLYRMGANARLGRILAAARARRLDGADTWRYLD